MKPVVLKLEWTSESPGRFVKTQAAGPHPSISDLMAVRWSWRSCISKEFPGAAAAGVRDHSLGTAALRRSSKCRTGIPTRAWLTAWVSSLYGKYIPGSCKEGSRLTAQDGLRLPSRRFKQGVISHSGDLLACMGRCPEAGGTVGGRSYGRSLSIRNLEQQ